MTSSNERNIAFVQNATIRENICFGRPFEEGRYWKAVSDSCLHPDLEVLPNGDLTEVGEKGISLSGGQKQRLNICRAIYCDTEIQIFDVSISLNLSEISTFLFLGPRTYKVFQDPLPALDAHVGKAVFQNVLQNSLSGKTRILVTHAIHFLPQVDYVYRYVISDGRVAEQGPYAELMARGGEFSEFIKEFGSTEEDKAEDEDEGVAIKNSGIEAEGGKVDSAAGLTKEKEKLEKMKKATPGAALVQAEERNTGAVQWDVYQTYIKAGYGEVMTPLLVLSLVLMQGATVLSFHWYAILFWFHVG